MTSISFHNILLIFIYSLIYFFNFCFASFIFVLIHSFCLWHSCDSIHLCSEDSPDLRNVVCYKVLTIRGVVEDKCHLCTFFIIKQYLLTLLRQFTKLLLCHLKSLSFVLVLGLQRHTSQHGMRLELRNAKQPE